VVETGERSGQPEEITLSGKSQRAYWMEVKEVGGPLTGWIFAAEDTSVGLVQEIWSPTSGSASDNHELIYQSDFSAAKIATLLGIKGIRNYPEGYAGYYHKDPNNQMDGSFYFACLRSPENRSDGTVYSGSFRAGTPTGVWKSKMRKGDRRETLTLTFGPDGKCKERNYEDWVGAKRQLKYMDIQGSFETSTIEADI